MATPDEIQTLLGEAGYQGRTAFEFLNQTVSAYWRTARELPIWGDLPVPADPSASSRASAVRYEDFVDVLSRDRPNPNRSAAAKDADLILKAFGFRDDARRDRANSPSEYSPGFYRKDAYVYAMNHRATSGRFHAGMPNILDILRYACQNFMPEPLVFDLYRLQWRRRYKINDSEAFLAFALTWLEGLNAHEQPKLLYEQVKGLARLEQLEELDPWRLRDQQAGLRSREPQGVRRARDQQDVDRWTWAMIEILESAEIIRAGARPDADKPQLEFSVLHRTDASFLFPQMLGVSTGDEGLDYLFYTGLYIPHLQDSASDIARKGPRPHFSMAITAPPGMGKTTLGLSLASMCAARGGLAVYFVFELEEQSLKRQLLQFHRERLPYFDVRSEHSDEDKSGHVGAGLLAFSKLPSGSTGAFEVAVESQLSDWLEFARKRRAGIETNGPLEQMVVFDTINVVEYERNDPRKVLKSRMLLRDLTRLLNDLGYAVVYLVEGDKPHFEDYFVDVDVRLRDYSYQKMDDIFRCLTIVKSRWQASHRGRHIYHIHANKGLQVYPSSIAVLTARRRRGVVSETLEQQGKQTVNAPGRPEKEDSPNRDLVDPGIHSFGRFFSSQRGDLDLLDEKVSWWHRGSVTAVVGPRGCLKSSVAYSFAAAYAKDQGPRHSSSALLLRFSEANAIPKDLPCGPHTSLQYGRITEYRLAERTEDNAPGPLIDMHIRSGHIAPADVLEVVRRELRKTHAEQVPIRRAVIQAVGNIQADYPTIYADRAFIPALREIFASEHITLMLVYSEDSSTHLRSLSDQLFGMADNIIRVSAASRSGGKATSIFVERSSDATHERGKFRLRTRTLPAYPERTELEVYAEEPNVEVAGNVSPASRHLGDDANSS